MKSIWVVEQGCYSDYGVLGVFSSEENAKLVADAAGSDAAVNEWPLDPSIKELRQGLKQYRIVMAKDGMVESCEASDYFTSNPTLGCYKRKPAQSYLSGTVWAKNDKHAIKITNERRAQMIAAGELN